MHRNISESETLTSQFYSDESIWNLSKDNIFAAEWMFLGDAQDLFKGQNNVIPIWLLEHFLDEPLLLVEKEDELTCMTNICTHRGYVMIEHPSKLRAITCGYHGRRFDLEGKFQFMPEFKEVQNFPRTCDHLHQLPLQRWNQFLFTALDSKSSFESIRQQLEERLYFLPFEDFSLAAKYNKTYNVHCHWALYCDNYLEGFHIPFVHNDLSAIVDYGQYTTLVGDKVVLQIGYSDGSGFTFDFPEGHPDEGRNVAAYYYWVYPNLMLNVYPWGVQLNIVKPITQDFTKVEFIYYIHDQKIFDLMEADKLAEKTEREDEVVVEAVHRGLKSRFYQNGRFSPKREKGVHYFHWLLHQSLLKE